MWPFRRKKLDSLTASFWLMEQLGVLCRDGRVPPPDEVAALAPTIAKSLLHEVEDPAATYAVVGSQVFDYKAAKPDNHAELFNVQLVLVALHHILTTVYSVPLNPLPTQDNSW